jgi:hypothetical protein
VLSNTHVALLVLGAHAIAFEYRELAIKKQVAEALNAVALPVFYQRLELLNSFDTFFTGDGIVCACEHRRSCFDASCEIFLSSLVEVAVLLQLLAKLAL